MQTIVEDKLRFVKGNYLINMTIGHLVMRNLTIFEIFNFSRHQQDQE